jgi:hypothetical protein
MRERPTAGRVPPTPAAFASRLLRRRLTASRFTMDDPVGPTSGMNDGRTDTKRGLARIAYFRPYATWH